MKKIKESVENIQAQIDKLYHEIQEYDVVGIHSIPAMLKLVGRMKYDTDFQYYDASVMNYKHELIRQYTDFDVLAYDQKVTAICGQELGRTLQPQDFVYDSFMIDSARYNKVIKGLHPNCLYKLHIEDSKYPVPELPIELKTLISAIGGEDTFYRMYHKSENLFSLANVDKHSGDIADDYNRRYMFRVWDNGIRNVTISVHNPGYSVVRMTLSEAELLLLPQMKKFLNNYLHIGG